jgi:hypothetical protein
LDVLAILLDFYEGHVALVAQFVYGGTNCRHPWTELLAGALQMPAGDKEYGGRRQHTRDDQGEMRPLRPLFIDANVH